MRVKKTGEDLIIEIIEGADRALCGTEIVGRSGGLMGRGTVYVLANRLETKGILSSVLEEKLSHVPGMPRRFYLVTSLGRRLYVERAVHRAAVEDIMRRAGREDGG